MKKAILFLTFNRLDYVKETFEQIRIAQPPRFYIASDGPREGVEGETQKVQEVRDYILNNIDWDCEVKTRFLDKNSGGCAYGVSGAVTWFFENEDDGIILEDDCVPSQSFFPYCEELLDKYKNDKQVWHIAGDAPIDNVNIKESYYFAKIQHCWGWASWADRWKYFKLDMTDYDRKDLKKFSKRKDVQEYWENILIGLQEHRIDSWAYPWTFWIVANDGYCINPVKNLISNIGYTGEHYSCESSPLLCKKTFDLENLIHPKKIKFNKKAIDRIYTEAFGIRKVRNSYHWYEYVFSVKNVGVHKVWTICGLKIKFKKVETPVFSGAKSCSSGIRKYTSNVLLEEGAILLDSASFRYDVHSKNTVKIGKDSMVGCNFIFESNNGEIEIGERTFINSGTNLISRTKIEIGDDVTIAFGCTIYDHNSHSLDYRERIKDISKQNENYRSGKDLICDKNWESVKTRPIKICDKAWLGFNVTVLNGVTIGEGAVVGACSVVRDNVEPWTVVAGNPAVKIKDIIR